MISVTGRAILPREAMHCELLNCAA